MDNIHENNWQLQEAKARLSEVLRAAKHSPQFITVHGNQEAVVISQKEYEKLAGKLPSLLDLISESPLVGIELDLDREKSLPRDIKL